MARKTKKIHAGQFTKETAPTIGTKGGMTTKLTRAVDYAEIGKKGAESRWKKISTGEGKRA